MILVASLLRIVCVCVCTVYKKLGCLFQITKLKSVPHLFFKLYSSQDEEMMEDISKYTCNRGQKFNKKFC